MLSSFAVCLCGKAEHQGRRAWWRRPAYIIASRKPRRRHRNMGWNATFPEHPRDPLSLSKPHLLVSTTSQQDHIKNQLGSNLLIRWEPLRSSHFLKALHLATKPISELLGNTSYPHHSTFLLLGRMDRVMLSLIWASPVSQFSLAHTAVIEMNAFISLKIKSQLMKKPPISLKWSWVIPLGAPLLGALHFRDIPATVHSSPGLYSSFSEYQTSVRSKDP